MAPVPKLVLAAVAALLLGAGTSWSLLERSQGQPGLLVAGDYSDVLDTHATEFLLFTGVDCEFSRLARKHLEERGTAYVELSVDSSPEAREVLRERLAMTSVPILVASDEMLTAYESGAMDRFIARHSPGRQQPQGTTSEAR